MREAGGLGIGAAASVACYMSTCMRTCTRTAARAVLVECLGPTATQPRLLAFDGGVPVQCLGAK